MKKILLVLTLLMTMVIGANAQSDGFFRGGGDGYDDYGRTTAMPLLPSGSVGSIQGDQPATAPLGSGLLIMTALGTGYMVTKRRKK